MKRVSVKIATTIDVELPCCPYCGEAPIVEAYISQDSENGIKSITNDVSCLFCGLSSTLDVWEAIGSNVEKPTMSGLKGWEG